MSRVSLSRLVAALITVLLLAAGLHAPAEAAVKRGLSMSPSATSALVKSGVKFSGRLSRSPKGSIVNIQRKVGTRWVTAKQTRTTNAAGNYAVVVTLPSTVGTYAFRAVAPARGKLRKAISGARAVKALTKTAVTAKSSSTLVAAGSNVTVTGTVRPFVPNTLASVQKLLNGRWTNVNQPPISANGTYSSTFMVGPTTQIRVGSPLVGYNATGYSPTITVTTTPVIANSSLADGTRTVAYSAKLTTIDESAGTWTAENLPPGLSLNPSTGVISGTPTEAVIASTIFHFQQTSTGRLAPPKTIEITVKEAPKPVISTSVLPGGNRTLSYSTTLAAQGNPAGTWSASPLPPGLSLSTSTGVISGTPTTVGTTTVEIGFTQTSTGLAAVPRTINLTIAQAPTPVITTSSLPNGKRLAAYSTTLAVSVVGTPGGTWEATGLPSGLAIDSATGVISGTPTGTFDGNVTFSFTQASSGVTGTKVLHLTVTQADPPVISTSTLPSGTIGSAYTTTLQTQSGATGVWTATPLPAGLSLNQNTGVISGTPTGGSATTNVVIGFTQTNSGLAATNKTIALAVLPGISQSSLPTGSVGTAYSVDLQALDSDQTGTWTAAPLPNGLSLNSGTGVVSGTPTAAGTTNVVITFKKTSSGLTSTSKTLALVVKPVITTSSLPSGTRISPYSVTLSATGTGTWTASPLPDGLSLDEDTGVISGTPTTVQTVNVVIGFTQTSTGLAADPKTLSLQIVQAAPPVISTSTLPSTTVNAASYSTTLTATGNPAGTWTASPLPAGLSLNPSTGVISGSPTASGTTAVEIGFTQTSTGVAAAPKTIDLLVNASISTGTLPDGTRTVAYPSTTVHAVGDPAGTWTADNLPAGLSISTGGVITGTPTAVGTSTVTLKFTQSGNGGAPQVTRNVALEVVEVPAPVITTTSLNAATVNAAYTSNTPAVTTTGPSAGVWSATGLQNGLSIASGTGVISGTPTASGTATVALTFTQNSSGFSHTKNLSLVVNAVITTSTLPDGTRTLAYPSTQVAAFGTPAGTWAATNLPAGLSISAGGVISGTPTAVETKTVTLKFTQTANGGAPEVTRNVSLDINEAANPTITTTSLDQGTVGTAYTTANLAATGPGNPAGTWTASPLPNGVAVSSAGVFSGTPTAAGTTSVVVEFTQTSTGLTASKTLALAVKPVITTSLLTTGTVGTAYSLTLAANGGSGTWTASPLPDGLSLNSSTGAITGTPTDAGTTSVVIGFTSGGVAAAGKTLDLDVKPVISTTSLADGTVGSAYSVTLAATGGAGTWTASPLPDGLSLNPSTGAITGNPTTAGTTNVVIGFTSGGVAATGKTLALAVKPVITTASLPVAVVGSAYSFTLDGTGTGTWTTSPLPAGLSLNTGTGAITGTPTAAGSTSVVIGYTSGGVAATGKTLDLDVKPVITTAALPDGTRTEAYTFTLTATGGSGTWTASPLPAGLTLNPSTGVISGTPTTVGTTNVVIGFTRGGVAATGTTLPLEILEADPPVITTTSLPDGQVGVAYSKVVQAQGDPAGTWSTDDPLPDGLSINATDGTISGTPTTPGEFTVVVRFEQTSTGLSVTKSFGLVVGPA